MFLTTSQRAVLREQLVIRKEELRMLVKEALAEAGHEQLLGQVHDRGEEAFADLLVGVDLAVLGQDTQELREVEAALNAVDTEAYGICVDCGGSIPFARLESQPTTRRCIECQTQIERLAV